MRSKDYYLVFIFTIVGLITPNQAAAWEWLRSSNENVEEGNEKMSNKDHKGALESYDKAARELPSNGGVHLNRGLALMQGSDPNAARQALLFATEPSSSSEVRADAYYNLGLSFYREADAKAGKGDHKEAQWLFREAADSFKRSLKLRPQNRDAAWNLELALRRIREEEQKQKEKEKEEKEKKEQEQKQKEQQNQDQQQQNEDGQQQEQDQKEQQQKPDEQKRSQDEKQKQEQQEQSKQEKQPEQKEQQQQKQPVPRDVTRALDALQNGEENLERYRARMRANRENRRPEKDW
jgi:Ca-activated chloride channel family protein